MPTKQRAIFIQDQRDYLLDRIKQTEEAMQSEADDLNLQLDGDAYIRRLNAELGELDKNSKLSGSKRPRYYLFLSVPAWMPEVVARLELADSTGKVPAGKYIRELLLWAEELLTSTPSFSPLHEPKYRVSTDQLDNDFDYNISIGKTREFTMMDSDRYLCEKWIRRLKASSVSGADEERLGTLSLSTFSSGIKTDEEKLCALLVFLIFADTFKGYLSWDSLCEIYCRRADKHRNDGNDNYKKQLRNSFRYRLTFSPDLVGCSDAGRHLRELARRADVPTFIRWLIRCDMLQESVPYPDARRKSSVPLHDGEVTTCVLSLEPGIDNDVKAWLDCRGWLTQNPTRWGLTPRLGKRSPKESWQGVTSVSHYVQTLIYDFYQGDSAAIKHLEIKKLNAVGSDS